MSHLSLYCILSLAKKTKKTMSQLKFSLNSFRELALPELVINIWSYADHIINKVDGCEICEIYMKYCVTAAKEKWSEFYIDFGFVIDNLKKGNQNWVDFGKFSTATKNNIYLHIAKTKVKTPRGTWKVLFE